MAITLQVISSHIHIGGATGQKKLFNQPVLVFAVTSCHQPLKIPAQQLHLALLKKTKEDIFTKIKLVIGAQLLSSQLSSQPL